MPMVKGASAYRGKAFAARHTAVVLTKVLRVIIGGKDLYWVREAVSFVGSGSSSLAGVEAGKATLKKQTIISSVLCWPQVTVLAGSGFSELFPALSEGAVHSTLVPAG